MISNPPTISITISTVDGWPEVQDTVASAELATARVGGEVIVIDGSGHPAPPAEALSDATRWESVPGSSVFQLRGLGYRLARAPIVGITEDHCRVAPDWAERMLAAHAAHPEAIAVGGSVENGATSSAMDWASFLVVQAGQMVPIESGPARRIAGVVNVSYKRHSLEGIDDHDGLGTMDVIHQRQLSGHGQVLQADDAIRVVHDQSLGVDGTIRIHYHAGRTFAGFLRRRLDRQARLRLVGVLVMPYARFIRTIAISRRKGYGPELIRTWPLILLLLLVQAAGQVAGFAAGPGDSPRQVR
jgi:hypothetical protein